jgi:hypothetical protein
VRVGHRFSSGVGGARRLSSCSEAQERGRGCGDICFAALLIDLELFVCSGSLDDCYCAD